MVLSPPSPPPSPLLPAAEGILAIKRPWPSMMRTVYGDHERFEKTYFSAFKVRRGPWLGEGGRAGFSGLQIARQGCRSLVRSAG